MNEEVEEMIIKLIRQYLSPEQVSGYLKLLHQISISDETIYRLNCISGAVYRPAEKARRRSSKLLQRVATPSAGHYTGHEVR